MKPVYETEPRMYYRWLFPTILFSGVILFVVIVGAVIGIRQVLATPRAPAEIAVATTEAIVVRHPGLDAGGYPIAVGPEAPPVTATTVVAPAVVAPPVVKWEYKVTDDDDATINKAGAEGWELVAVDTVTQEGAVPRTKAYLKRPLATPATGGGPRNR